MDLVKAAKGEDALLAKWAKEVLFSRVNTKKSSVAGLLAHILGV